MLIMKVLCKKLRSAFLFIIALIRKIFCFWRRKKKIDDALPSSIVVEKSEEHVYSQWDGSGDADQWHHWNKKPFTNVVEEKIEEYRRKQVEAMEKTDVFVEPDYFNDMQPEVKRTRKKYVGNLKEREEKLAARGSLFAFSANEVPTMGLTSELGTMEDSSENEVDKWDDSIDIEGVDEVLKEQRARERREKQSQRRMERERRLLEKKGIIQS